MSEKVRLRIGSLAKAVLITGQAYQDPKDALNEFVSNAADEYLLIGSRGDLITVRLRRKGRYPQITINDIGRGMTPDRLRDVARNLFRSVKAGDDVTLGEKAIGLLAFQQLGERCEIVSRAEGSTETWVLKLARGKATADLGRESRRRQTEPGTTVYLLDLDPEVLRTLTQRKVVDYMRGRRAAALERGDYELEIIEGRTSQLVTPEAPEGLPVSLPSQRTLWGTLSFSLWVSLADGKRRKVSVVGRAGTAIVDDISEMDQFDHPPWNGRQVAGRVMFEALQQTAGRRAIVRDRTAFPVFAELVRSAEAPILRAIDRVNEQVDRSTADRLSDTLRRVFRRVLKELDDVDNPMRTRLGSDSGEGALWVPDSDERAMVTDAPSPVRDGIPEPDRDHPPLPSLNPAELGLARRRTGDPTAVGDARLRHGPRAEPLRSRSRSGVLQHQSFELPLDQARRCGAARLPGDTDRQGIRRLQQPAGHSGRHLRRNGPAPGPRSPSSTPQTLTPPHGNHNAMSG